MSNIHTYISNRLEELVQHENSGISEDSAKLFAKDISRIVDDYLQEHDGRVYRAVKGLSLRLEDILQEMSAPESENAVDDAKTELNVVIESTENATDTILDATEAIQKHVNMLESPARDEINQQLTKIVEACNFQDITGQRIKKVGKTLTFISDSVGEILLALAQDHFENTSSKPKTVSDMDEALKQGPSSDGPSQDEIDKLFESA